MAAVRVQVVGVAAGQRVYLHACDTQGRICRRARTGWCASSASRRQSGRCRHQKFPAYCRHRPRRPYLDREPGRLGTDCTPRPSAACSGGRESECPLPGDFVITVQRQAVDDTQARGELNQRTMQEDVRHFLEQRLPVVKRYHVLAQHGTGTADAADHAAAGIGTANGLRHGRAAEDAGKAKRVAVTQQDASCVFDQRRKLRIVRVCALRARAESPASPPRHS